MTNQAHSKHVKSDVNGGVSQHALQGPQWAVEAHQKGLKCIQTLKLFLLFLKVSGMKVLGLLFTFLIFCIMEVYLLKPKCIFDSY